MNRYTRRGVLRGLLGGSAVALGLPWLEARAACDTGFPKRFGVFTWGNGNLPDRWTPSGQGVDWTPSEQLAPLAAWQSRITVCTGLEVKVPNISPHWSGAVALLTGQELVGDDDSWTVPAPTIDEVVADAIGADTLYRSVLVGIADAETFSYQGPNAPNFGETSPFALYERLFGGTFREPGKEGVVDPSLGRRRSVLDAVLGDLDRLSSRVSAADRVRLEAHTDAVRDLEQRLARLQEDPPDLAACERPVAPERDYPDIDGRQQLSAKSRAFADLIAMSFACDQTRVFNLSHHRALSNVLFPGATDGHHNLTHNEGGEQPEVHTATLAVMEELAYLYEALDRIPEGDGTVLDHSLVLACSDVSEGRTHRLDEIPFLLAGGACGAIPMGRHVRSGGRENVNKAMFSVLSALDVPITSWGAGDIEVTSGWDQLEGA
jgi:hypothetical protein